MIWCVEDDSSIRDIEIYTLHSIGMDAKGFENGEQMFEEMKSEKPDLILLDIMLPGEDGVTILKRLKNASSTREIPIIMATAKGMEYDKIESLDLGADDYLVKPFGMMEMVSRMKAVLRRCQKESTPKYLKVAGITLYPEERKVLADGKQVELTYKEFEMLFLFISHPGKVYTRDQLLFRVWGTDYAGETRTVDVHIRTLRQKLGNCGNYIVTVRNVGYRLEEAL